MLLFYLYKGFTRYTWHLCVLYVVGRKVRYIDLPQHAAHGKCMVCVCLCDTVLDSKVSFFRETKRISSGSS